MDKNAFLITLSESAHSDFGRIDFAKQAEVQQIFSAVWELESQVNNGGFDQYFRNSDVDIIGFAPIALKAIGADECAKIVETAIRVISPFQPVETDWRAALDAVGEQEKAKLTSLNTFFFEYPDNLTDLLFAHVVAHPDEFGPISK